MARPTVLERWRCLARALALVVAGELLLQRVAAAGSSAGARAVAVHQGELLGVHDQSRGGISRSDGAVRPSPDHEG